jgi:hypothetical protein
MRHAMQLRVARLCLDCEELYVGSICPVCASERSVFLTTWLPVEERRRWRRSAPRAGQVREGLFQSLQRRFARWLGDDDPGPADRTLRTRASDRVQASFDFDQPSPERQQPATPAPELVRDDR